MFTIFVLEKSVVIISDEKNKPTVRKNLNNLEKEQKKYETFLNNFEFYKLITYHFFF